MNPKHFDIAYEAYVKSAQKPLLTHEEFQEFWNGINDVDQSWWLNNFRTGKTHLTKELLDLKGIFTIKDDQQINPVLYAAIESIVGYA